MNMSLNKKNDAPLVVIVREMEESDAAAIASIWSDGLSQTTNAMSWRIARRFFHNIMEELKEHALSETGDVGPNGKNLMHRWLDGHTDRTMLVAELCEGTAKDESSEIDTTEQQVSTKIVGCCGVKIGTSETDAGPEDTVASVWRVSVDESYQQRGIGRSLMNHAEQWALQHGAKQMQLVTANPIAAVFYKHAGYVKKQPICEALGLPGWFVKDLVTASDGNAVPSREKSRKCRLRSQNGSGKYLGASIAFGLLGLACFYLPSTKDIVRFSRRDRG